MVFLALEAFAGADAQAQTIIADDFNVANVGTGFLLGEGASETEQMLNSIIESHRKRSIQKNNQK